MQNGTGCKMGVLLGKRIQTFHQLWKCSTPKEKVQNHCLDTFRDPTHHGALNTDYEPLLLLIIIKIISFKTDMKPLIFQ